MNNDHDLTDYTVFFEAEPVVVNPEVGWLYGSKFESFRNNERLVAVIAPGDGEFSFQWWQGDVLRADLNLQGVVNWVLDCTSKKETLFLKFHQQGVGFFSLQLKPAIAISWVTKWA